jgi:hypothetical protein
MHLGDTSGLHWEYYGVRIGQRIVFAKGGG